MKYGGVGHDDLCGQEASCHDDERGKLHLRIVLGASPCSWMLPVMLFSDILQDAERQGFSEIKRCGIYRVSFVALFIQHVQIDR